MSLTPSRNPTPTLSGDSPIANSSFWGRTAAPMPLFSVAIPSDDPGRLAVKGYLLTGKMCAYSAFEMSAEQARGLLFKRFLDIHNLLIPAIREALLTDTPFYRYLIDGEYTGLSLHSIHENIDRYANDLAIASAYILYQTKEQQSPHPAILQALAHIHNKEIHIWKAGEGRRLVPHREVGHYDYACYRHPAVAAGPVESMTRIDLLLVDGNRFEGLAFMGFEKGWYPTTEQDEPVYPYLKALSAQDTTVVTCCAAP